MSCALFRCPRWVAFAGFIAFNFLGFLPTTVPSTFLSRCCTPKLAVSVVSAQRNETVSAEQRFRWNAFAFPRVELLPQNSRLFTPGPSTRIHEYHQHVRLRLPGSRSVKPSVLRVRAVAEPDDLHQAAKPPERGSEASPPDMLLKPPTRPNRPLAADDRRQAQNITLRSERAAPKETRSESGGKSFKLYKLRNLKDLVEALEAQGVCDTKDKGRSEQDLGFSVQALFRMADMLNAKSKPSKSLVDRARVQVECRVEHLTTGASRLPLSSMCEVLRCSTKFMSPSLPDSRVRARAKAVNAASRLSRSLYPSLRSQPRCFAALFAAASARTVDVCDAAVAAGSGGRLGEDCELDSRTLAILLNALSKAGRVSGEVCESAGAAVARLGECSGQDAALLLNAFSKAPAPPPRPAYRRLAALATSMPPASLDAQAASMIANAMAKAEMREEALLEHLSGVLQALPSKAFSAQAVSTIANAYARLGLRDPKLFAHLERTAMLLPASAFSSQAVSTIINSFVKAEAPSPVLFRYLAGVACQIKPQHFSAQSVALILHGFGRCGIANEKLFWALADATMQMRLRDLQAVASVIGSFSYVGYDDPALYQHLVASFMNLSSADQQIVGYDGQKAGMILGAAVKHDFLSAELLERLGALLLGMDRQRMQPFDIASIAHALSRSQLSHPVLQDHLAALVKQDEDLAGFSPPMLAMLVAAYTRSAEWDLALLGLVTRHIARQHRAAWELPDLINLLSTILRVQNRVRGCAFADLDFGSDAKLEVAAGLEPAAPEECQAVQGMTSEEAALLYDMLSTLQRCAKERVQTLRAQDLSLSLANSLYSHCTRAGLTEDDEAFGEHVRSLLSQQFSSWLNHTLQPAIAEFGKSPAASKQALRTVQDAAQTVSVVAASLATAGGEEEELWAMTTKVILALPKESFNARSISTVLNAFARRGRLDQRVLERCSYILQFHVAGDIDSSIEKLEGNYELWKADAAMIGSVFNAYAKLQVTDTALFKKLSRVAKTLEPCKDYHPVEVSMIVNALARLEYADDELFAHLREAVLSHRDKEEFGMQAVANIANAYARVKMLDADLVAHLAALVRRFSPPELSAKHVATLANAWAKAEVKDDLLWAHLAAAIRHVDPADLDLQAVANVFHAMATLHVVDVGLIRRLSHTMVRMPVSASHPQAAAIIAWSVAVLQPFVSLEANLRGPGAKATSREVVEWVLEAAVLHWQSLDRHCLSQVHQLLVGCRLANLTIPVPLSPAHHAAAFAAFRDSSEMISLSSNQQADVARTMASLGYALEMEHIEPASGYSFDIWVPLQNLVVEFDGPFHFCNGTRVPLGSTVMKHRHIRQMGYTLVIVPFWAWDASAELQVKQATLEERIQTAASDLGTAGTGRAAGDSGSG